MSGCAGLNAKRKGRRFRSLSTRHGSTFGRNKPVDGESSPELTPRRTMLHTTERSALTARHRLFINSNGKFEGNTVHDIYETGSTTKIGHTSDYLPLPHHLGSFPRAKRLCGVEYRVSSCKIICGSHSDRDHRHDGAPQIVGIAELPLHTRHARPYTAIRK